MRKLFFISFLLFPGLLSFAQYNYPATKTVDSTDTYFGVVYKDPYRWLENLKDTAVVSWFKQQADFTNDILNKISGRDALITEWKALDKLQPASIHGRVYANGRIFYKKTMPGENVGKIYFRQGMMGYEELLFDPATYISGKMLTVESALPSYDGNKIAIAYSQGGAEVSTIIIIDVATKKILPEIIFPVRGLISWTFDNKSLTYLSQNSADNTDLSFEQNTKTRLHKLGEDSKKDADIFSADTYSNLDIQPRDFPIAGFDKNSVNYIFGGIYTVRNEYAIYYAPTAQFNSGKTQWRTLCKPEDKLVRGIEYRGEDVYAITYKDAKNYKLVYTSLKNPDWQHAKTIVPEKQDQTLESITQSKSYLYLTYSNGIDNRIYKYNFTTGKLDEIKLPYTGTAGIFCLNNKTDDCMIAITSWNKPNTEFNYNPYTNIFTPSLFNKPPKYPEAYKNLEVKEVEVKSYDGTMVPLSIIYKKGIKLDGNNCCIMEGYGAYGTSIPPYFDMMYNSLAVKGVVIALAHVRGGSEKGEAWYKAGYKTTKPNTWKDFNSCAEYLIANGYTSSNKLTGNGTSAGGILISRAITERPDLYGAAICNVGDADAMRAEFTPNGPINIPEFGTVKDSVECAALYEMDGVQHVKTNVKYPAVICIGGWNDPRVIAWEPGKFAAALQQASTSGKPVLMKVNYDNGHFTEDKNVTYANFAGQFAFALWQCGHPAFQLKR